MLSTQLETLCVKFQQNFEILATEVQFTRICKEVAFIHEVAVGRFYRTIQMWMMVSEIEPFVCTECTSLRAESDSRIFAAIKQRTIVEPVLQVHIIMCLGIYGIEIQIPSTISTQENFFG